MSKQVFTGVNKSTKLLIAAVVILLVVAVSGAVSTLIMKSQQPDPPKVKVTAAQSADKSDSVCGLPAHAWVNLQDSKVFPAAAKWVAEGADQSYPVATIEGYGPCGETAQGIKYGYARSSEGVALLGINYMQTLSTMSATNMVTHFSPESVTLADQYSDAQLFWKQLRDSDATLSLQQVAVRLPEGDDSKTAAAANVVWSLTRGTDTMDPQMTTFDMRWVDGDWQIEAVGTFSFAEVIKNPAYNADEFVNIMLLGQISE